MLSTAIRQAPLKNVPVYGTALNTPCEHIHNLGTEHPFGSWAPHQGFNDSRALHREPTHDR